jgi:hypothetical protein
MNDVARLTAREAELNDLLTETTASRDDLDSRLAATQAAFEHAVTRDPRASRGSKKAADVKPNSMARFNANDGPRHGRTHARRRHRALEQVRAIISPPIADRDRLTLREADLASQLASFRPTALPSSKRSPMPRPRA